MGDLGGVCAWITESWDGAGWKGAQGVPSAPAGSCQSGIASWNCGISPRRETPHPLWVLFRAGCCPGKFFPLFRWNSLGSHCPSWPQRRTPRAEPNRIPHFEAFISIPALLPVWNVSKKNVPSPQMIKYSIQQMERHREIRNKRNCPTPVVCCPLRCPPVPPKVSVPTPGARSVSPPVFIPSCWSCSLPSARGRRALRAG